MKNMMFVVAFILFFSVVSTISFSEDVDSNSGDKLYLLKPIQLKVISSSGTTTESLNQGDVLISLGQSQNGYWYKVKTPNGAIGSIEITDVTHECPEKANERRLKESSDILNKTFKASSFYSLIEKPYLSGKTVERVKNGDKLKVLSIEDGWCKVQTRSGNTGYIKRDIVIRNIQRYENIKAKENQRLAKNKQKDKERVNRIKTNYQNWSIEIKDTVIQHKVQLGMTMDQCRESWGKPYNISNTRTKYSEDSFLVLWRILFKFIVF